MVVHDFDVRWAGSVLGPLEANPPLHVDANAELPCPVPFQAFESVAGQSPQILKAGRAGQGKSGGYRTLIALRRGDRAVLLYGFAKNERSNIDAEELDEFRRLARGFLELTAQQIGALIAENELMEVNDDEGA